MHKFVFSIAFSSLISLSAFAEILSGRVVGVADGDTVTLLDSNNVQYKIRLMGIDAPEKSQAFGRESKKNLSDLIFSKKVSVDWKKKDRYMRIVGKITLNGDDVCLAQVRSGLAWHYKQYEREQSLADRKLYADAEVMARRSGIGLWSDPSPIEPSKFRRGKR